MFQLQKMGKGDGGKSSDLTGCLISAAWSGDVEQAGRKLEFDLAWTTKDKAWTNPTLELGDKVQLSFTDEKTQKSFPLFEGTIFARSRESASSTMHFTAFDDIIYLAK